MPPTVGLEDDCSEIPMAAMMADGSATMLDTPAAAAMADSTAIGMDG